VPPFNGHPEGFSAATLELLDQGLKQIWHEMQIAADAKAKTKQQTGSAGTPSAADIRDPGTRREPALESALPAIAK
jgi:hypothetical protein